MLRYAVFFIMVFLVSNLAGQAGFLLSIEEDRGYTERYSLSQLLEEARLLSTGVFQDDQSDAGSRDHPIHRFIQLSNYTIPEKQSASAFTKRTVILYSLPSYPALWVFSARNLSATHPLHSNPIKFPIQPLLRSAAFLI